MQPRLVAISGPLKGSEFELDDPPLWIGREKPCRILLDDDRVSRRHCKVFLQDGQVCIADCDSMNGTFVNNKVTQETPLHHGDRIKVCQSEFVFLEIEDEAAVVFSEPDESEYQTRVTMSPDSVESLYLDPSKLPQRISAARVAQDLGSLLQISQTIVTIPNARNLQRRLLESILNVLPAQRAAILLAGDKADEFVSATFREKNPDNEHTFRVSRTITHQVMESGEAVLSNEVMRDEAFNSRDSVIGEGVRSVLCVPLMLYEKKLGVIYADSVEAGHSFDEAHLRFLNAAASIASVSLEHARHVERLESENERLQQEINVVHGMVGGTPQMKQVLRLIEKVAPSSSTVLIRGESGTGKEMVARAIHQNSPRASGPFLEMSCVESAENLIEDELFGHEKGAFTGATAQRIGKIELANHGTLFLDEIGDMSMSVQPKLLRVLQERKFWRVGGSKQITVDVRIVAATNRKLEEAIRQGKFREDLFFRINVVRIQLPPLRDRRDDILPLAHDFVRKYSKQTNRQVIGISPEAARLLLAYDWPGNVRELQNAIEHAVVMGFSDQIMVEDLPQELIENRATDVESLPGTYHQSINALKKELIIRAVRAAHYNHSKAAKSLGLHANYLFRLIKNLGIKGDLETT